MKAFLRCVLAVFALAANARAAMAESQPLVVFAAASLKSVLDEAAALFEASGGAPVRISYAGSLALARQLEQGAPADIFAAADVDSMDYAQQAGVIREDSRVNLLGNALVLVTARPSSFDSVMLTPDALRAALAKGRIAAGEVNSVPAGKYAKAALISLGLWEEFGPRLAMSENVRAALAFVARNELPLGIVYRSDAKAEPAVKVVATFAEATHAPILYPFALTKPIAAAPRADNPQAAKFLTFLRSASVTAIFIEGGFDVLR